MKLYHPKELNRKSQAYWIHKINLLMAGWAVMTGATIAVALVLHFWKGVR